MSGAERLRAAADRLTAYEGRGAISTIFIPVSIDPWLLTSVPATPLAVLLWAVDSWPHDTSMEECLPWCRRCAAERLADTVLGGTE